MNKVEFDNALNEAGWVGWNEKEVPTETPEEKEALDLIDTAPQQAESLTLRETAAHETLDKSVDEQLKTYRYEKVTESIFDLKDDYCSGQLKFNDAHKYETIIGITDLAHHLLHDSVYRRIEVTERELFIEEACKKCDWIPESKAAKLAGKMFDAGCRFVNGKG